MVRRHCPLLALFALLVAAGCGPRGGLLIRPVSTNQELTETTVHRDPGRFIRDKVAVIEIDGMLANERSRGLLSEGENPVSLFTEKLAKAREDDRVCGVILRINSPGGTVTACDIMHEQVRMFRRERPDVPVVALIDDVGASGAYYIACAAQEIWANPTSVTGSIGVVVPTVSVAGTMDKLGVTAQMITSAPFKDMANPLKPLDPDDLAILQGIADEFHRRFVSVVVAGRAGLDAQRVGDLADGRVYTGQQARANGLVDRLGRMPEAVERVKALADAKRVEVVMYHRPHGYRGSLYAAMPPVVPQVNLINITTDSLLDLTRPRFMYLWTGR